MRPAIVTRYTPPARYQRTGTIRATGGGRSVSIVTGRDPGFRLHARAAGLLRLKLRLRGALIAGEIKPGVAYAFVFMAGERDA